MRQAGLCLLLVCLSARPVMAQDPPPRIGPYVIDLRGTVALFPKDQQLADSRSLLSVNELPGAGLGVDGGAHVYLFTWKAMTVGIGGQAIAARSHATPAPETGLRPVTELFTATTAQLSLNFGSGNGWSYLSGGIGVCVWSIVPDNLEPTEADVTRLRTVNYGGGARWFIKPHVALNLDARFHQIDPGSPTLGRPGSPRTTFMILGAGISLK
jgi:hypothetical protein